ncbi:hypothetical protein OSCT_2738 [Oscillochloris trichoides DG-6]|uniref:NADH:quinone oxidoreductase/Mrp antiporter membrane subunit domain-containing protein n=1 Tax=Oscillochloris trichoides DG-6 TaxID=765420 RepID=E1IHD7_9CHLR|nr:hypothetical protein [Oscillochloris trichoides]EFO79390.1 hypothetical protein OSCT_2738 [Oscillochloris trichoides DG-6]
MLVIVVILLLIVAAACIGLSRFVPTRQLGLGAAALFGLSGLLIAALPNALPDLVFPTFQVGAASFEVAGQVAAGQITLVVTLLWGAGLTLAALAMAIAPKVRDFGGIFGWASLATAATLLVQAAPPFSMFTPLAWAVVVMASYAALRSTGTVLEPNGLPRGLALGLLASGLLLGALLGARAALAHGELPAPGLALAILLAVLAITGTAPLGMARDEAVTAPAPLGALIYGLLLPMLGLGYLLRLVDALPNLPTSWALTMVGVGALGSMASAAAAYSERRLHPLLGWVSSAQASLVVVAAGLGGPLAALAGAALLFNLMLATIAAAAAVVDLERNTGSDTFAEAEPGPRLKLSGTLWIGASLAAVGLPPLWGFWGRSWLFEALLDQAAWAIPLLVVGHALLGLALLLPLARFWPAPDPRSRPPMSGLFDPLSGMLALLPLLIFGLAPQLAWQLWLHLLPASAASLPIIPSMQVATLVIGVVIAALVWLFMRLPVVRQVGRDPEEEPVQLAADGLAHSLRPFAWFARTDALFGWLWERMLTASRLLQIVMSVFEQRYYLLGVMVALLTVMLLMAQ